MKVSERLELVRRLSAELHERYTFPEAFHFLRAFLPNFSVSYQDFGNVQQYASYSLSDANISVLGEMVDDLGMESIGHISAKIQHPKVWEDSEKFRVFISHISGDKDKAMRLRDCFAAYNVSAFVAHEDILPTLEWQVQIERALHSMEAFISVHTSGYSKSFWCQQETGFAVARGIKIIALRMGEDPTGFISKNQALSRGIKTAEQITKEIDGLLSSDERTKARYAERQPKDDLDDDIPF